MDWLGIKLFHKTQRDLATSINYVIDQYWEDQIDEKRLRELINILYMNNDTKFIKDEGFTTVLKQQCGKRRLEVVSKILSNLER